MTTGAGLAPELSAAKYTALFEREAREQLRAARACLGRLSGAATNGETLDALFRSVHTVKGMAGAMGYAPVEELAHQLEDTLGRLRRASTAETDAARPSLAAGLDALEDAVEASIAPHESPSRIAEQAPVAPAPARTLRVDVAALDRLLDLAGELTSVREHLAHAAGRSGNAPLARAVAEFGRLSGLLADEVRSARLVSLADLLTELPRLVRQVAHTTGKQVTLETSGGDVVADRAVVDALTEPLTHLLRNAVDHGIEAPHDRVSAGKSPVGRVTVRIAREGNALVVRVKDDGRGVDRAAVVARAQARGQFAAGSGSFAGPSVTADLLDDAALLDCLALPGLSTAEAAGRVSGRGVGVDAALARVRALGGALALQTTAGAGTCFTLRMPLSWAVVPALIVRAGGSPYALPLAHVCGTRDVHLFDPSVATLAAQLGRPAPVPVGAEAAVVLLAPVPGAPSVALAVDALVGARDCVLKPVAVPRGAFRIAAGATILEGGEVALVLDIPAVAGRPAPAPLTTQ